MSDTNITSTPASAVEQPNRMVQKPTRVRYQVLAIGCALAVVTYIHRVGFSRALPDLGLTSEQAGWVMALFQLAYGAFEMPCGLLGDRLGTRHLLTLLVLGSSLLTGCVALAVLLPAGGAVLAFLLFNRFVFGMFQAGTFPLLSRMMTDWIPLRERASAQGLIWMASRGGGLVAPFLFTALAGVVGSWETALWLLALLGVLWCAAFWPWFRNRPEETPNVNAAEREHILAGRATKPLGHGVVPWGAMLRSPSVWGLCLMYGCGGFAANFYVTLLSTYLRKTLQFPDDQTDWIAGLPFACGMAACVGGGFLSDGIIRRWNNRKWGRRINGLIGLTLGAFGWLSLIWVHSPWAVGFAFCFIFFCNDLNMGPAWAACADIGEKYAGTLGGTMNMIGAILGAVGNLIAGHLFLPGQPADLLFVIYAGSFFLAGMCWFLVDVTKPLTDKNQEAPTP
ncbi:MAG TPA: MFS transporter [Gemmataceae bacterium]|nr:MFS transporter [Gemmataceae bacterium]